MTPISSNLGNLVDYKQLTICAWQQQTWALQKNRWLGQPMSCEETTVEFSPRSLWGSGSGSKPGNAVVAT